MKVGLHTGHGVDQQRTVEQLPREDQVTHQMVFSFTTSYHMLWLRGVDERRKNGTNFEVHFQRLLVVTFWERKKIGVLVVGIRTSI